MDVKKLTGKKELDSSDCLDLVFVRRALQRKVCRIPVQDIDIFGINVKVFEKVFPHESVVAFTMIARQTNILVHIESDDVLERNQSLLVVLH